MTFQLNIETGQLTKGFSCDVYNVMLQTDSIKSYCQQIIDGVIGLMVKKYADKNNLVVYTYKKLWPDLPQQCFKKISRNMNLKTVWNDDFIKCIIAKLRLVPKIVSTCDYTFQYVETIIDALRAIDDETKHGNVVDGDQLDLSNCTAVYLIITGHWYILPSNQYVVLAQRLRSITSVYHLALLGCETLSQDQFVRLVSIISEIDKLESLKLDKIDSVLPLKNFYSVIGSKIKTLQIHFLTFHYNYNYFVEFLEKNTSLRELHITREFSDAQMQDSAVLCNFFETNRTITSLTLPYLDRRVLESVQKNYTLTNLSINKTFDYCIYQQILRRNQSIQCGVVTNVLLELILIFYLRLQPYEFLELFDWLPHMIFVSRQFKEKKIFSIYASINKIKN